MKILIALSMLLNVFVLVPVTFGIMTDADWTGAAYGPDTPTRGIVLAFYLAILVASVGFLFKPMPEAVSAMLALQIMYKVLTPVTVGTVSNPVVMSNLGIAAFHAITLFVILIRAEV